MIGLWATTSAVRVRDAFMPDLYWPPSLHDFNNEIKIIIISCKHVNATDCIYVWLSYFFYLCLEAEQTSTCCCLPQTVSLPHVIPTSLMACFYISHFCSYFNFTFFIQYTIVSCNSSLPLFLNTFYCYSQFVPAAVFQFLSADDSCHSYNLHWPFLVCYVHAETGRVEGQFSAGLGLSAGAVGQQPFTRQLGAVHPSAVLWRRLPDRHLRWGEPQREHWQRLYRAVVLVFLINHVCYH